MDIHQIAILWDMDGVLIDSGEPHFVAWVQTLADYKIAYPRATFNATFGMNNGGILEYIFGYRISPELEMEISERKEASYRQAAVGNTHLLPGVKVWLDYFLEAGVPQAVTSGAPQENIDTMIRELQLQGYFGSTISGYYLPSKPDPEVFLLNARQIGIPPGQCIVIEDAVAGVQGALSAGMKCIAVTTTHPAGNLQAADMVVDRLDEIHPSRVLSLFPN